MSPIARAAHIAVDNFRGFQKLELSFREGVPHYLIGPNNAGKSTILSALALGLKAPAFWKFTPEEFDFFRGTSGKHSDEFNIVLELGPLDGALPAVQGVGNPEDVHAIHVRGRRQSNGRLLHRHLLLGEDRSPITISPRTPLRGTVKEKYAAHDLGYRKYYARMDDIRDALPEVWLLTPENLERSLYAWKTGPLRRLARLLTDRFFDEEWELEIDGGARRMPETLERVHEFLGDAVQQFPFWVDDLKPKLEDTLGRYIGRQAGMALRPSIQAIESWLTDQLVVAFSADAGGPVVPLERTGLGWQSLVRMAALDVLRQYPEEGRDSVVVLYEEPETFLHPHLRRKLRGVLDSLAGLGWMIVVSTHAPEFLSLSDTQVVVRLQRVGEEVTKGVLPTDQVQEAARFQELIDERGNHEFLFANRAVLCEGKDDVFAVRTYLEKSNTDLDGRSVSLVDLGGVQNLPAYAEMASKLGIPWCGLTDEDRLDDGEVKPTTQKVREDLESLKSEVDLVPIWSGSLESCLGVPEPGKARPEWQHQHVYPKSLADLTAEYPDFVETCSQIRTWVLEEDIAAG